MLVRSNFEEGILAFESGNYARALELLEKANREDPDNLRIDLWLAKTYRQCDRKSEAIAKLQKVLEQTNDLNLQQQAQQLLQELMAGNGHAKTTVEVREVAIAPQSKKSSNPIPSWSNLSLRFKGTLLAMALGIVPVLGIGTAAYYFTGNTIAQQSKQTQANAAAEFNSKVNAFLFERYGDIQVMSQLTFLTDPDIGKALSLEEKTAILNKYQETYGVYDSIAFIDLQGNVTLQSDSEEGAKGNHANRDYVREALATQKPVIGSPSISKSSGKASIYFATPVREITTGQIIGVIRARLPVSNFNELLKDLKADSANSKWYIVDDATGDIFAAGNEDKVGEKAIDEIPNHETLADKNTAQVFRQISPSDRQDEFIAFNPLTQYRNLPPLDWSVYVAKPAQVALAAKNEILSIILLGTGVTALLVGALAIVLADRSVRPIVNATRTVEELGKGNLDVRLPIKGKDELATLGNNINQMAGELQSAIDRAQQQAKQRKSEQEKLQNQVDAIAQSVNAIAAGRLDTRIPRLEGGNELVQGLAENINQMTAQIQELVREQEQLAQEQKAQADNLTKEVLQLLSEVKGAAKGDLTVKARVGDGEMGAVADSFNYLVGSLRRIVTNIKDTATQVSSTTGNSIAQTTELTQQAQVQASQVDQTLQQIERVIVSIEAVAKAAERAEAVVEKATQTAQSGGESVDRTVQGIEQLRQTIGEAAKMMKRLGEGSQQIGQIVTLISQIADKTDLLALNATIEAARAGEQGQGFAVVADEVRKLAERSAGATKEIAEIVDALQTETSRAIAAMDAGTEEVVKGTQLAAAAKDNLQEIIQVSREINQLVQNINQATNDQTQVAAAISQAVEKTRTESTQTAQRATEVSASLDALTQVVDKLHGSVQSFRTA